MEFVIIRQKQEIAFSEECTHNEAIDKLNEYIEKEPNNNFILKPIGDF